MKPLALILTIFLSLIQLAAYNPEYLDHSENPPLTPIEYRRPGFWIARHHAPDSLILAPQEIEDFNARVLRLGQIYNMTFSRYDTQGWGFAEMMTANLRYARAKAEYHLDGSRIDKAFWEQLSENIDVKAFRATARPRFAFPIRFTSQRIIPTSEAILELADDPDFDYAQNSGADIGDPTIIFHESRDGKWLFGYNRASAGWYPKEDMCLLELEDWQAYKDTKSVVVTTSNKSDLWLNKEATDFYGFIRMGNSLPLLGIEGDYYKVALPSSAPNAAYIHIRDAHPGFLPYTARNLYNQAFKLLNTPYGWGDMNGEYDCSGIIKQIFQCFGIYLPRNGSQQSVSAIKIHQFKEEIPDAKERLIVEKALPGITLLRFPGHIMLYLGAVDGKAYILHSTWGARTPGTGGKDQILVINKVVVSDLSLGEGSQKRSLLQRLTDISKVSLP